MEINGTLGIIKDVLIAMGGVAITAYLAHRSKQDEELWRRVNKHGHVIECEGTGKPKTTQVTISQEE